MTAKVLIGMWTHSILFLTVITNIVYSIFFLVEWFHPFHPNKELDDLILQNKPSIPSFSFLVPNRKVEWLHPFHPNKKLDHLIFSKAKGEPSHPFLFRNQSHGH